MKILGEKVYLTPICEDEVPAFTKWVNDPDVTKYMDSIHNKGITLEDEMKWFKTVTVDADELLFSVYTIEGEKLIGNCGIHLNATRIDEYAGATFLGILIGKKDEWGKGYGTEVISLLLEYLKGRGGTDEVFLTVDCENLRAQKVYEKCGFVVVDKKKDIDEYVMKVELT